MKSLKSFFITALFCLFFVNAANAGESVADIKAAIDQTIAKVEETIAAAGKGEDSKKIGEMIVEARQLQKSISSSDSKISIKKSQSNNKLVNARTAFLEGNSKEGNQLLQEALAGYKEVKEKFDATH